MVARRFLIAGRVQQVGFRWFVVREAERLGVAGWARNLPDGRVEVTAQGTAEAVERLAARLGQGPAAARVDSVQAFEASVDPACLTFGVRH
ncbi:MAG TPA: acylphosphatase [Candidatus Polarisedimenticolia bacterium]|nr:acylphosphatase [Candidatus Polarisedimenticolia bacterium]